MKSPDEIKKGLEYLSITNVEQKVKAAKKGLPYAYTEEVAADALVLIQQFEAERDALMHYLHSMGCDTCLYDDYDGSEPPCINCTATRDLWQFQGVQKEESNA